MMILSYENTTKWKNGSYMALDTNCYHHGHETTIKQYRKSGCEHLILVRETRKKDRSLVRDNHRHTPHNPWGRVYLYPYTLTCETSQPVTFATIHVCCDGSWSHNITSMLHNIP